MKLVITSRIAILLLLTASVARAQSPKIEWSHTVGASTDDYLFSVIQTSDGGYAACGLSKSDDAPLHHPSGEDAYVVKFDANGQVQWQKCYGGSLNEEAFQIIQTQDGGYAVATTAESSDGDVPPHAGGRDAWIVKLNDTGKVMWTRVFGGPDWDQAEGIVERKDTSLIFCGYNRSTAGEVSGHHGGLVENDDGWLVKLNSPNGASDFEHFLGGSRRDQLQCIIETRDGGLAAAGLTSSFDYDLSGASRADTFLNLWVTKIDASGQLVWSKQYGGSDDDWANSIQQTADGGFVVAGAAFSSEGEVSGQHGNGDGWVLKLDSVGTMMWQSCLGGSNRDGIRGIVQDQDGGYTAVGTSMSFNDTGGGHGNLDGWILKLDTAGRELWQKLIGGSDVDILRSITHTNDGAYVVVGETLSKDFDISAQHPGYEGWILKFSVANSDVTDEVRPHQTFNLSCAQGMLKIDPMDAEQLSIRVSNVLGVSEIEWSGHSQSAISLDASSLPTGTYFVTVRTDSSIMTRAVQIP